MEIVCPCGTRAKVPKWEEGRKKYCSKKCFYKYRKIPIWNKGLKGIHLSPATEFKKGVHYSRGTEFKKGNVPWTKGKKGIRISPKTEFTSERVRAERNNKWAADNVGYFASHGWIQRNYGRASHCENRDNGILSFTCKGTSFWFEWAFKHKRGHRRDIKDYFQLCKSCHAKYDRS